MDLRRTIGALGVWGYVCAGGAMARAEEVRVDSQTMFQAYDVQSPASDVVWARRRLTQTLGLQYVRRLGDRHDAPSLQAQLRLRLDQDFGQTCLRDESICFAIVNPQRRGSYTPIAPRGGVDLPSGFVELAQLPAGARIRVGRQLQFDQVGFARFDGIHARTAPRDWIAFEVAAGMVVRRTSLAGADAFGTGSLFRADLAPRERERFPYLEPGPAPWLASVSGELGDERIARGRATLRTLHDATGFLEQRLGIQIASRAADPIRADVHAVFDAIDPGIIEAQAGAQLAFARGLAQARLERHEPRFEPSTIWAYFDTAPISIATLAGHWLPLAGLSSSLSVRGRRTELEPEAEYDLGVDAALGVFDERDSLALAGFGWIAERGPLWGASVQASRRLTYAVTVEAEMSLYRVDDPLRDALRGISLQELLGVRFELSAESELRVIATHSYGEAARHRLACSVFLHLEAWR